MPGKGNIFTVLPALLLAALLAIPLPFPADNASSPRTLTVWFESPTVKVRMNDPARSSSAVWDWSGVHLSAARGEHEGFQTVVEVGADVGGNITLAPFNGPSAIPASSVGFYEVEYPANTDWPDPLSPTDHGVSLNGSRNNPILVDISVPDGAVPGNYYSNLTIVTGTEASKTPVVLTVWNITLPQTSTLKTWFDDAAGEWASYYGYQPQSPEGQALMTNVFQQYKDFRISPGNIDPGMLGRNNMTVNNGVVSVDFSGTDPWLEYCLDELNFTSFRFPLTGYSPRRADEPPGSGHPDEIYYWRAPPYDMNPTYADQIGQYIKLVADHYRQKGWLDKAYVYVTDEPIAFNDNVTSLWQHPDYHVVQQFYDIVKANAPDLKFVNTVQLVTELFNYTDVWAIPGSYYHELDARARMEANQSVWWYNVDAGIASPGTEGRALYWDTFARGVQGVLYWGTNYWDYLTVNGDPWQGSNSNGDGYLFYPEGQYPTEPKVAPSVRLFLAREGLEDYELLNLYGEKYGMDAARAVAESVAVGSSFAGERHQDIDAQLIYDVREWLAGQITQKSDERTWTDTFRDASNISAASGLVPDFAWEGSLSLAPAHQAVMIDSLDSLGGWHPNNQAHIFSSVTIDDTEKTEGAGSLRMDFWRDDDPGELGGYDHMRNGRVVTSSVPVTDWSGYDLLEMDVRSVEHPPGNLYMLVGDTGGTVVSSDLHAYSRYTGGPDANWTHVVIDISGRSRSSIQYIEPIVYNYFCEIPYHHYSYWLDNITVRQAGSLQAGTLVSKPVDLGPVGRFLGLDYITQWALPPGNSVSFETRTSPDLVNWSPWASAIPAGKFHLGIASPAARYLQYRADFVSDGLFPPALSEVRVDYDPVAFTDLLAANMTFDPLVPNENDAFNINVIIGNKGPADVKGATLRFEARNGTGVQPITIANVDAPAGAAHPVTVNWTAPLGPLDLDVSATITPPAGINDTDPSDDTAWATLHINDHPRPSFDAPAWAHVGDDVVFNASSSSDSDGIAGYLWTFQDRTLEGPVVNRSFAGAGAWNYSLTVTDPRGASSSAAGAISVYNHTPVSSFVISPVNGTVATDFTFISTVYDPDMTVTNTTWFFSDGYRAFGRVATHRFVDDTGYDINCTVTYVDNGTALRASAIRTLLIENTPPTAAFTATAGSVAKRQLVGFDASSTTDPDEELGDTAFAWTFGDGASAAGKMAAHSFAKGGMFNVTLTVTDERGASSTFTLPIQVINQIPVSVFAAPLNVSCNQSFTLDASASRDPDGTIVEYSWEFDDGTMANGVTVTYAFSKSGPHTVSLVVTDDDGAHAASEKTIRADPVASIPGPGPRPPASSPGTDGRVLAAAGLLAILLVLVAALAVLSRRKGPTARADAGAPAASPRGMGPPGAPSPVPEPPVRPPEAIYHEYRPIQQAREGQQVQEAQTARPAIADSGLTPPPLPAVTHHRPPKVVRTIPPPPPKVVRTVEPPGQQEPPVVRFDESRVADVSGPGAPPERQTFSSSVPDESWRLTQGAPVKGHVEARPAQKSGPVLPIQRSEGEADPTLPFNPWATRKK